MTPLVRRSYRYCEQIARTKAANFYPAFRLLPRSVDPVAIVTRVRSLPVGLQR